LVVFVGDACELVEVVVFEWELALLLAAEAPWFGVSGWRVVVFC